MPEALIVSDFTPTTDQSAISGALTDRSALAGGVTQTGFRSPYVITSSLWLEGLETPVGPYRSAAGAVAAGIEAAGGARGIVLHAGPKQAEWSFQRRGSEEEIASGVVRYSHARLKKSSAGPVFMANPKVTFTFQGGNIMPVYASLLRGQGVIVKPVAIAPGLRDWYLFNSLINQPDKMPDGSPNYVWIYYNSHKYPSLLLKGYFQPEAISITDASEEPFSLEWSAGFTVYESSPELHDGDALISEFNSAWGI